MNARGAGDRVRPAPDEEPKVLWAIEPWLCLYSGAAVTLYAEGQVVLTKPAADVDEVDRLATRWLHAIQALRDLEAEAGGLEP